MVLFLTIVFGLLSIVYGVKTSQELLATDPGSQKMQDISDAIAEGAQAYLKRQYTTIGYVGGGIFVILVVLLGHHRLAGGRPRAAGRSDLLRHPHLVRGLYRGRPHGS